MKLFISLVALVASTLAAPTSHTLNVGQSGIIGSNAIPSPLVSILININQSQGSLPGLVSVVGNPAPVEAIKPEPVHIVDAPLWNDVLAVALPEEVNEYPVVDTVSTPIVVPGVESSYVPSPVLDDPVSVAVPSPVVIPESPAVVPSPVVIPESPIVVPSPIIPESPVVVPSPVFIEPSQPEAPVVVEQPSDVAIVDVTPALDSVQSVTNNYIINVILNFVFGNDGTPTLASVDVPAQDIQQVLSSLR